jgi:hypothetical protein
MFVLLQKHMYMRMVSLCDLHLQGSVIHMPTSYMSLHATQFFMPTDDYHDELSNKPKFKSSDEEVCRFVIMMI